MRTCLACRQVKTKGELTRLVRLSSGVVEVDTSGKKSGRGTYLCRSQVCWETGLKGGRLEHSLKTTLTRENREQLSKFSQDLLRGETRGKQTG
ncbi:MAG: YlxR family protein [Chloroflexota bacterium]